MTRSAGPSNWSFVRLIEAAEVTMGSSPPGESYNDTGVGIPLINGPVEFSEGDFGQTIRSKFTTSPTRLCKKGDLLLCVRGSTTGRTNIAGFDACIGRGVASIRALGDQPYLNHFIRTQRQKLFDTGNGSTFPSITQDQLASVEVPLPPLPEQRRIAAILDKADAIYRKREKGIRLTEELLRSTFLEMFGDPVSNPREWTRLPLGDVLHSIENGWSPKCVDRPVEAGEWGVLKLGAVTYCKYQPCENKALPTTERPRPEIEVKTGDLLLTRKNTYDLVAACAFVFDTPPRLMLPDLIFRLRLAEKAPVVSEYLWGLLTHAGKRKEVQALAGGSAGSMPNISKEKLRRHPIEVPPLRLQERFGDIMHRLHQVENARRAQQAEHKTLFQALVQQAFRGEL